MTSYRTACSHVSRLACVQGLYEVPAHVNLSNNRLTAMPAATVKKPHIKRLDLQHNSIAFVPDTIDRLTCLTHIDLSHNSLDELPAQVSPTRRQSLNVPLLLPLCVSPTLM